MVLPVLRRGAKILLGPGGFIEFGWTPGPYPLSWRKRSLRPKKHVRACNDWSGGSVELIE